MFKALILQSLHGASDETTIWAFRERLSRAGFTASKGHILHATVVKAPTLCFTKEDERQKQEGNKSGEIRENEPRKARQKDTNASWTVKANRRKSEVSDRVEHVAGTHWNT